MGKALDELAKWLRGDSDSTDSAESDRMRRPTDGTGNRQRNSGNGLRGKPERGTTARKRKSEQPDLDSLVERVSERILSKLDQPAGDQGHQSESDTDQRSEPDD